MKCLHIRRDILNLIKLAIGIQTVDLFKFYKFFTYFKQINLILHVYHNLHENLKINYIFLGIFP
jgi:hypothetical protein